MYIPVCVFSHFLIGSLLSLSSWACGDGKKVGLLVLVGRTFMRERERKRGSVLLCERILCVVICVFSSDFLLGLLYFFNIKSVF